ncbi:MAG TPA: type 4a pilus biogenesis protein PilO [Thermoanaerobaculia bacterium]|nr:type 4a pilus biogenesis protein PilO [Thermoanaerobaculia bacterium]
MIWREKKILLIVLGVLLAINVAFFLTYRVRYQQRIQALDMTLDQANAALEAARSRKAAAEQTLTGYKSTTADIQRIYNEVWSTPQRRLTSMILEIRDLENRSRMVPRSTSFTQQVEKKEFGTRAMTMNFMVRGTYAQVRQFINLLELSQNFVVIDQITLADSTDETQLLNLNIQIKTLFHEPLDPSEQAARRGGTS